MRGFDSDSGMAYGYVRTGNSFEINRKLYTPANADKSDEEIFTRTDNKGRKIDLETVRALDRTIAKGGVPKNAIYTRFTGYEAIQSTFGLSDVQMSIIRHAAAMRGSLSGDRLNSINDALRGSRSLSRSYTSASANRRMNVFQGSPIERKLYAPKGTRAFGASKNSAESEVVFGRGLQTELMGVTVGADGHLVFHERVVGYKKRK